MTTTTTLKYSSIKTLRIRRRRQPECHRGQLCEIL